MADAGYCLQGGDLSTSMDQEEKWWEQSTHTNTHLFSCPIILVDLGDLGAAASVIVKQLQEIQD